MIQQVIQGKASDIHTRIIISPTKRTFNKPIQHAVSESSSSKNITDIDVDVDDYYCGECAEDDLKQ